MLKRINRHAFTACAALFAFLGFLFLYRLTADSPKMADIAGLIVSCAMFGVAALAGLQADLERNLEKWLEPKTGTSSGSVNAVEPYRQRSQREDLEQSLVHALAPGLLNRMDGKGVGEFIRTAADSILSFGLRGSNSPCTCAQHEGAACSNCPVRHDQAAGSRLDAAKAGLTQSAERMATAWAGMSAGQAVGDAAGHVTAGAAADQRAEAEIVSAGLTTAPRVTAAQIQALMDRMVWRYEHEDGSRHTFAHAFLDDFYIATGHNAPVSRENFDASLGMKYAREQAEGAVRDRLWGFEGYLLRSRLKGSEPTA